MSDGRTPHDDDDPLGLGFGSAPGADGSTSAEEPPPTEPLAASDRPWTPAGGTPASGDDASASPDAPGGDAPTSADPFPWLSDAAGAAPASGSGAGADAVPPPNDDVTQVFGAVPPAAPPSQAATTVYPTGYEAQGAAPAAETTASRFDPSLFTPLASTGGDDEPDDDDGPSKKPLIVLGSIGGVLVIGIVILLLVLFTRGGGDAQKDSANGEVSSKPSTSTSASPSKSASPSASATPSATPSGPASSAPPTTAPPVQVPAPVITSFSASSTQIVCASAEDIIDVTFTWAVKNSQYASFDGGPPDTVTGKTVGFKCSEGTHTYSLTAYATSGSQTATSTVKVTSTVTSPPPGSGEDGGTSGG